MKKTVIEFQNEYQKEREDGTNFKKMKSSEILLKSQCDKILGGANNVIIIADKDIF